jgi:hypothetical protein
MFERDRKSNVRGLPWPPQIEHGALRASVERTSASRRPLPGARSTVQPRANRQTAAAVPLKPTQRRPLVLWRSALAAEVDKLEEILEWKVQ